MKENSTFQDLELKFYLLFIENYIKNLYNNKDLLKELQQFIKFHIINLKKYYNIHRLMIKPEMMLII